MQLLKDDIRTQHAPPKVLAELMVRIMYLQLLGFDASFAYVSAINLSQHSNPRVKRLGYLVSCSCISHDSQLLILLVSSLQRDLVSPDPLCVSAALTALSKVSTPTMMHALVDVVTQLLHHSVTGIKAKAAAVLQRFLGVDPTLASIVEPHIHKLFLGEDLTCLMTALNFYETLFLRSDSIQSYRFLVKPLSFVIRGLATRPVPDSYQFHGAQAPWVQMQAMKVMALIGDSDPSMSIQIANVLLEALRVATARPPISNINQAIVYQIHLTAAHLKGCGMVLSRSCELLSGFLSQDQSNNLIYAGVTGLMKSFRSYPAAILQYQLRILDYLDDSDVTLRNGTLKVLVNITGKDNVIPVCNKLLTVIPKLQEEFVKQELIQRVSIIAYQYSSDLRWSFGVGIQLLSLHPKSTDWTKSLCTKMIKNAQSIRDAHPDVLLHILGLYAIFLTDDPESRPADLLKAAIWTIGEFSQLLDATSNSHQFDMMAALLPIRFEDASVTHWLLTALQKMHTLPLSDTFKVQLSECSASIDPEIQQRCYEFARLSVHPEAPRVTPGSFDFDIGSDTKFLESFALTQRKKGARSYREQSALEVAERLTSPKEQQAELRFTYGTAIAPKLNYTPLSTARVTHRTGSESLLGSLWGYFASAT